MEIRSQKIGFVFLQPLLLRKPFVLTEPGVDRIPSFMVLQVIPGLVVCYRRDTSYMISSAIMKSAEDQQEDTASMSGLADLLQCYMFYYRVFPVKINGF